MDGIIIPTPSISEFLIKIVREHIFKLASFLHYFELETQNQSRVKDYLMAVHKLVNSSFIQDQLRVPVSKCRKMRADESSS